ncbi:MAG: aminotransferase class III-fold pyridoxal phosphate-dependent enzyme [Verrucomicrobiota bacterium]|nr:aminotransferase class III-fold pyridoxal phosphate-dependent enzyme [Verrucomicrobiota bacterium]
MEWWKESAGGIPHLVTDTPGPMSRKMNANASRYMKGLSEQALLFPVCFEQGHGIMLKDVDGNRYLDFSSGIYVTSLGHCHPKVSEAVCHWANKLMNCHDFTTPVKEKLLEKMVSFLPGDLKAMQFYSDGASAVEAGLRAARAATSRHEFISCYRDFHGKSMGAVSCAQMARGGVFSYGPTRGPGLLHGSPAQSLPPPVRQGRRRH